MSLKSTIVQDYRPSKAQGRELMQYWRLHKPRVTGMHLQPGNFVFTNYVAISPGKWDYNPVVMILRTNRKYVFGINVNWLTKKEKRRMLDYLILKETHKKKGRVSRLPILRETKRFKFTRRAYRLYFRKELRKPVLYRLEMTDVYDALNHNLRKVIKNK